MGTQARRTESGVAAPGTDVMVEVKVDISSLKANVENIRVDVSELREEGKRFDTKLETLSDRHERDFRVLFGTIISVALGLGGLMLGLGGLMAKGFGWLH